jgi:hypothetical protein
MKKNQKNQKKKKKKNQKKKKKKNQKKNQKKKKKKRTKTKTKKSKRRTPIIRSCAPYTEFQKLNASGRVISET